MHTCSYALCTIGMHAYVQLCIMHLPLAPCQTFKLEPSYDSYRTLYKYSASNSLDCYRLPIPVHTCFEQVIRKYDSEVPNLQFVVWGRQAV